MAFKIFKENSLITITSNISGYRATTSEVVGDVGDIVYYSEVNETIRKQYWWTLQGVSIEFDGNDPTIGRGLEYITKGDLTGLSLTDEVKDSAYARIGIYDSITIWIHSNRQDLWKELVEYFGSEDKVWSAYIKWRLI